MNSAVLSNGTVDRESTSGVALRLLPIINALEHDDGTQQSQHLASLLQQLPGLSSSWSDRDDSTGKEAACASLLSGLNRLVKSQTLLPERCECLSAVVKDLMVALIKEVFPDGTSQQASTLSKRTAAYTMLKLILREGASMLPLLPADALGVFQLASKAAVLPDKGGSQADGLRPGVTTRADHALPLIIGLAGAAAQIVCAAERRAAGAGPAAGAVRRSLDGSGGLDAQAEGLLGAAQWACGVLQVAIQRLTGGVWCAVRMSLDESGGLDAQAEEPLGAVQRAYGVLQFNG
ncbi:hypothetical protein DUNSADRAFT_9317 [Dunaliella salina]|uniref:Uncharacterized protein n=1 Tax=Dunaliella salina TaxID=3046 RepID=A0ABQ7GHN7_DUNSA|nr:hypothetical protein DUNSADRAFT_9317 [Dunaliella salina]|eukprot:KAF5834121.1 hypothetical protein DUNSADRAFT_9317 [Dunaliella salina]